MSVTAFGDLDCTTFGPWGVVRWQELEQWAEKTFAVWNGQTGILQFSHKGLELSGGSPLFAEHFFGCRANFGQLVRWQLNGAVNAIKNPAQNFFAECPAPFAPVEFLEGNWFIVRVGGGVRCRWEN